MIVMLAEDENSAKLLKEVYVCWGQLLTEKFYTQKELENLYVFMK